MTRKDVSLNPIWFQIHSLWDTLIPIVCSDKTEKDLLKQFWQEIIEGSFSAQARLGAFDCLCSSIYYVMYAGELFTATHNTQYLIYQLVERTLAVATADQIPTVLSRAFIRRMLKESSGSLYMQAAAKHTVRLSSRKV